MHKVAESKRHSMLRNLFHRLPHFIHLSAPNHSVVCSFDYSATKKQLGISRFMVFLWNNRNVWRDEGYLLLCIMKYKVFRSLRSLVCF